MQATVIPGVAMWSLWQPERNVFFNSFFIETPEGNLVVDPLAASDADIGEMESRGGIAWIVVTNRDHERGARTLAARFDARLATSSEEAKLLSGPVDRTLLDRELFCGARIIALEGLKTPGEFALHLRERETVLVGDALWGDPAGSFRLMPDEKLADPPRAAESMRRLAALVPQHVLVGDGACIFGAAQRAIWSCLEARRDVYVNRMNVDEVAWEDDSPEGPAHYRGSFYDIGRSIGAEKLGYQLGRLGPGIAFCPEHWHLAEEELFVILEGAATLCGPRGSWPLRRGDLVAFPTRPSGSHKIVNESSEPCTFLAIANTDAHDVCFYPNSEKVLIEATRQMLRAGPQLDYFDGE